MKNVILIAFAALFGVSAFCDECWSTGFRFDGSEITEEAILLKPTDTLAYSSALAEGEPKSLTINVEDTANPEISASIFADYSETAVEGTETWDYKSDAYKDFPTDDTYLLTETVTSDTESKVLTRKVTILPEPFGLLLIAFIGTLILSKRTKNLIAILAIIALSSFSARANSCVSNVKCLQMWPFDRSVIINYTLTSAAPIFDVKFYGSLDNGATTFDLADKGTITRDGADGTVAGAGVHKTIWTPDESFYKTCSDDMLVKVEAAGKTPTYIVIDLSGGEKATSFAISYLDDVPEGGWTEEYKTTKLVLRKIEPGTFTMGSPEDELGRHSNETQHEVTLTNAYYIGAFETTQKQYELVMGYNPSKNGGAARPVECVSYDMLRGNGKGGGWSTSYDVDDDAFFGILRAKTQLTFDLPTEAQWEYACRAGTTTALNDGSNLTNVYRDGNMNKLGRNHYNNEDGKGGYSEHTTVGSYLPNAWGLYDMHGNVSEWCMDWYQRDLGSDPATEPLGTSWGAYHILRGGDWYFNGASYCRSAYRYSSYPGGADDRSGFRVVLVQNVFSGQDNQIKKDFEFEIESGTENTLPIFQTKFYGKLKNGTEKLLEDMGRLEYDGASGIVAGTGKHKLTWIPDVAYTNIMDEVEFRVEYEDVTEQANYLVLDTTSNKMRVSTDAPDTTDDKCRTDELWLRRIEPGTFTMGSPEDELGSSGETQHEVTLTRVYYIGVFEMTQKQCLNIMGANPSYYKGDLRPAECISYDMLRGAKNGSAWPKNNGVDERSFMGQLRKKAGNIFDLPTEAQWEYACRAGTTTALNSGKNLSDEDECDEMAEVGRYYGNMSDEKGGYGEHTTVGSYLPNAWGLYDMHGNVYEWCLDWYESYDGDATDPKGGEEGSTRVLRGGGWWEYAYECRSARRNYCKPGHIDAIEEYAGFRVVLFQNVSSGPDNQIQRDFEFEIESGTENTLPIFQTKFYGKLKNGREKLLEEMGKLEYDGASGIVAGIGKHNLTWTPYNAYTNIMDEVELRVEYEDVTEQAAYLVLDTTRKKMRVSPDAPDTTDDKCRTDELWLRRIEPGTFTMGSPEDELRRNNDETQHEVTLTKAYYIGVFEMTQKQCQNIMGVNPSSYKGDLRPAECVSYDLLRGTDKGSAWPNDRGVDENSFMGQLRKKAGNIFDLPTEAQWEYACRAGTTTALNSGKNLSGSVKCEEMAEVGRYLYNGGCDEDDDGNYLAHAKVGSYLPNAWGLYDMHGNVCEWCLDWYESYDGDATDPKGGEKGSSRVLRGGSWLCEAFLCRSAYRDYCEPDAADISYFGFRVVLVQ